MNPFNQSDSQQGGSGTQSGGSQASEAQQGTGNQAGGQAQQFSPGAGQQQGGGPGPAAQQRPQQQGYGGGDAQERAMPRRSGGMPSLSSARSSAVDMLRRLDEDMDRLFQQFWGGNRGMMRRRGGEAPSTWLPQIEVCEQGGKLHVYADLPGMRREDVKVCVEGDQLVIEGERRSEREEGQQGGGFYHTERSYGTFYRSIPLPEGVDPQSADASFRDGVLDVTFNAPRAPQQQRREINVRDESGAAQGPSGAVNRSTGPDSP